VTVHDTLHFAFTALARHRRRSLFSVLGMTVGVAAVIVLTALGEGAQRYVTDEFSSLGSELLIVIPGKNETTGGVLAGGIGGVPNDLTLDDALALERGVPGVSFVVPIVVGNETISHLERSRQLIVAGATHDFLETRELRMGTGQFLPRGDLERGAPVAVIGTKVASELFGHENPLGRVLRIGDWRMRTIGVLEAKGQQIGLDIDDLVIIPVASAMRMFDRSSLFRILLRLDSNGDLEAAKAKTLEILTERHDEEDVTVISQESVVESLSKILNVLTLAVAAIGAISLSVAGLGVMNLMLVSVSERTSEVGLLKALGAKRRQVHALFLAEAVLLALAGGVLGIAFGFLLVEVFKVFYPSFPAAPPVWAIVSALGVAIGMGSIFGVLPARQATNLDPVAALSGR
jgi:putative ABC transport system permease protein